MQQAQDSFKPMLAAAASHLKRKDLRSAALVCRELTQRFPELPRGWMMASHVALLTGDTSKAVEFIDRGLALAPDDPALLLQKAQILRAALRIDEAIAVASQVTRLAWQNAELLNQLGFFYTVAERHKQALEVYSRAVDLQPGNPQYRFNRATIRRFLGDLDGAEADYDSVIADRPGDCEAYYNRSELRTQTEQSNHINGIERLLASDMRRDWQGNVQLVYALAKEYEDLGRYEASFAALAKGAALRRKHLQYDIARDVETADAIRELFTREFCDTPTEDASKEQVIFILGMPRTGTTLVERMLGSHSDVESAGELNDFARAMVEAVERKAGKREIPRQELIRQSLELDFAALGREYIHRARSRVGGKLRFIDKMPMNYLYCGLIARALPEARIVQLTRHPMATCFAVFKTLFKQGYPFSYDIQELAQFYAGYLRLTDHWQGVLGDRLIRVDYENLVTQPESQLRRLLDGCGLDWQQACLDFHNNPAPSTTASAAQVRRPMYTSSIDRWRSYEDYLQPLRDALADAGVPETLLS